jgi:hypothetical protein
LGRCPKPRQRQRLWKPLTKDNIQELTLAGLGGTQPAIAILVLAHQPAPLQYLLDLLDNRFAIYVHLDAKTPTAPLRLPAHATLIERRIEVFWGGWSMMQATLALIDAARARGGFRRYFLVSGDSLPMLPLDQLEAALLDDSREYIELIDVPDDPTLAGMDMQAATERHGWVQPWRLHNPIAWDHRLLNPLQREAAATLYGIEQGRIDWIRGDIERLLRPILSEMQPPRPFRNFYYGAQWWALTAAAIEAILPDMLRPDMQRFFRYIQQPDEHFIQTILGNRPEALAGRTVVGTPIWTDLSARARGIDTLDRAGFRAAAAAGSQILFARKFNPTTAPDVAAAIRDGVFETSVLGGA